MKISSTAKSIIKIFLKEKLSIIELKKLLYNYFTKKSDAIDYLEDNNITYSTLLVAMNIAKKNKQRIDLKQLANIQLYKEVTNEVSRLKHQTHR